MTTYTAIPNSSVDTDSPVTQDLMTLLRDNPIAGFEGADDAPINQACWHPYDGVLVNDGADGEFYDFSVDGGVTTVDTPNFSDGYEYAIFLNGMQNSGGILSFNMRLYLENTAALATAFTYARNISTSQTASFWVPMNSEGIVFDNSSPNDTRRPVAPRLAVNRDAEGLMVFGPASSASRYDEKITYARLDFSNTTTAGKAHLFRRRLFTDGVSF